MKRGRREASPFLVEDCFRELEVPAALRMAAVAIDLNSVAGSLTRSAAVLTIGRFGATTHRVLTSIFLVCHGILLKCFDRFEHLD